MRNALPVSLRLSPPPTRVSKPRPRRRPVGSPWSGPAFWPEEIAGRLASDGNPGQGASPMRFSGRQAWRALRPPRMCLRPCPGRCQQHHLVGLAEQVARYFTGPRSASTVRRSPSTAALTTFRSASAFASTVSLSARLKRFACRSFVVRSAELGDRRPAGRPSRFFWAYAKRPRRQRGCGNWCHC
jgi:hypothetical protein